MNSSVKGAFFGFQNVLIKEYGDCQADF